MLSNYKNALEYPNILLCFLEIKRKKAPKTLKGVTERNCNYYQSQVIHYKSSKFYRYMQIYFEKEKPVRKFKKEFTLEKLEEYVKSGLNMAIKSPDSYAVDMYYFDLNQNIGYDSLGKEVTGINVVTLKGTKQLLAIEPVDVIDSNKIFLVNKYPYQGEKTRESTKVLYKSQIEKFNRRYNRD